MKIQTMSPNFLKVKYRLPPISQVTYKPLKSKVRYQFFTNKVKISKPFRSKSEFERILWNLPKFSM